MSLDLFFLTLLVFAVAAEIILYVGKDLLAAYFEEGRLTASVEKAKGALSEANKKIASREKKLSDLMDEISNTRHAIHDLEEEGRAKRIVKPVLIHVAGQGGTRGPRFRAPVTKKATGEPNQKLIWDYVNFVDVWTDNVATARATARPQFPEAGGYTLGEFRPLPPVGAPQPTDRSV